MAGGSGSSTPYNAPATANSSQSARFIDVISEGPIAGFANGDNYPLKSVFLEDTPIQNADGTYNFKSITMMFRQGTAEQTYLPTFNVSERVVAVSSEVKRRNPIVRTVTDKNISSLRITLGINDNAVTDSEGNTNAANTEMLIELLNAEGVVREVPVEFNERTSGQYYQDFIIDKLPEVPFNIRVSRVSADSLDERTRNKTYFSSYVEAQDVKLSYPHTALAAVSIDSLQFGNNFPRRNYLIKGRIVKVPSNYDPENRTYDTPVWNGLFKEAWTNNPAWILYDILTQPRFSTIARRIRETDIDKWQLYKIAKYCDELVDDGFGGKEPRFVCNAYLVDQRKLGELIDDLASGFTGMPIWNGNTMSFTVDQPVEPVAVYTNENVVDGLFSYESVGQKAIHTAVVVQYADKHDSYKPKSEYIADNAAIAKYGLNVKKVTSFGCDTRSQAYRYGKWVLQSELRQQLTVSFKLGREGLKHVPFDVFTIMDNDYAGAEQAGRVVSVQPKKSTKLLTLDKAFKSRGQVKLTLMLGSKPKQVDARVVVREDGSFHNEVEVASDIDVAAGDVWVIQGKVKPQQFRAVSLKEDTNGGTYEVAALLHDPDKYEAVDTGVDFNRENTSVYRPTPTVGQPDAEFANGEVTVKWDAASSEDSIIDYEITVYKDGVMLTEPTFQATPEYKLYNLSRGTYQVVVRARGKRGEFSKPVVKSWTVDYDVKNLKTEPRAYAVNLSWSVPQVSVNALSSEVWYGTTADPLTMKKLATLPYPQNTYTLTGVSVTDVYYFAVRIVDADGNTGEFSDSVQGRSDTDPAPILKQLQGAIGRESLTDGLWQDIQESGLNSEAVEGIVSGKVSEVRKELQAVGRNYVLGTGAEDAVLEASGANQTAAKIFKVSPELKLNVGDKLTLSYDLQADNASSYTVPPYARMGVELPAVGEDGSDVYLQGWNSEVRQGSRVNINSRQAFTVTVDRPIKSVGNLLAQIRYIDSDKVKISNVKLEKGDAASGWSPAPEDGYTLAGLAVKKADALSNKVTELESGSRIQTHQLRQLEGSTRNLLTLTTEGQRPDGSKIITGIAQGVDGKTGRSELNFRADTFALVSRDGNTLKKPFVINTQNGETKIGLDGDLISDGTIHGRHIAAGQTIQAPQINGGSLNIGDGNFTVSSDGILTANNAVVRGRIEADSGYFNGTVRASSIEGDVMKAHRLRWTEGNVWVLDLDKDPLPRVLIPNLRVISDTDKPVAKLMLNGEVLKPLETKENVLFEYYSYGNRTYYRYEDLPSSVRRDGEYKTHTGFHVKTRREYPIQIIPVGKPISLKLTLASHESVFSPFVSVSYLSQSDYEYKQLLGKMVWRTVAGSFRYDNKKQVYLGGDRRVHNYQNQMTNHWEPYGGLLQLPDNIYGISFEYRLYTNDDWSTMIAFDRSDAYEVVRKYRSSGFGQYFLYEKEFDTAIPKSNLLFFVEKWWQYIELRNIRVLIPESRENEVWQEV